MGRGGPAGVGKWRASSHHCWDAATSHADTDVCRDARWSPGVPRWPSLSLSGPSSCLRALLTAELWAVTKQRPPRGQGSHGAAEVSAEPPFGLHAGSQPRMASCTFPPALAGPHAAAQTWAGDCFSTPSRPPPPRPSAAGEAPAPTLHPLFPEHLRGSWLVEGPHSWSH